MRGLRGDVRHVRGEGKVPGLLRNLDRFVEAPEFGAGLVERGEAAVGIGVVRVEANDLYEVGDGFRQAILRGAEAGEIVERIGVRRVESRGVEQMLPGGVELLLL